MERKENQKLTLMRFFEQECNALPPRLPQHLPGTWLGRLGAQTGPVNKSARGLNRGGAVIKLRPEAIAREMSGILTKCPG